MERELSRLSEMFSYTGMLAGAELCQFARVTHKMSKISASLNLSGTKSIVDDLGSLFATQRKTTDLRMKTHEV